MNFLERMVEKRSNKIDPVFPGDPVLAQWFGGRSTSAGVTMTRNDALTISPWYAGVSILADTLGEIPAITYRRNGRGKDRAVDHPVYKLLHQAPNPLMNAFQFFQLSMYNLLHWGNHFAEIERNGAGQVVGLWPIPPQSVKIQVRDRRLWYYLQPPNGGPEIQLRQDQMLHVRSLSSDGVIGIAAYDVMRDTLGLSKAEQDHRAHFFKNDARPAGIIEYPGQMTDEAYKRYKHDWQDTYGGLGNKFRIAFLEMGLKYHETQFTPQASEFNEGRKFQVEDVARGLRLPLILLQSTEKSTSWGTGIEQFLLAFRTFTMQPWATCHESQLNLQLFTERERSVFFVEFLMDSLLRGDKKSRAESLQIERRNGVINGNDWAAIENYNPLPNGLGDIYIVEGNMTRLEDVGRKPTEPIVTGE